MATSYDESIIEAWDYWCYFQKVKRNRLTGFEIIIDSGEYVSSTENLLRVGERVSYLDSTYDLVEKTVVALRPDLSRLCLSDLPIKVDLMLYLLSVVLTDGESVVELTVKPWANPSSSVWTSETEITYDDLVNYYIPFDLTSLTYSPSEYEVSVNIESDKYNAFVENIDTLFIAFMQEDSGGILITAEKGYVDVFGPGYSSSTIRPYIKTIQTITGRSYSFFDLDTEVTATSKVKGVCRDREGNILTGERCKVVVCDKDNYKILGTSYSSSANGSFLTTVNCKAGKLVIASFYRSSDKISGSELMVTVSKNTTGHSISSSSSSSSMSSSSSSNSSSSMSSSSSSSAP
jgi:hypothetical protein